MGEYLSVTKVSLETAKPLYIQNFQHKHFMDGSRATRPPSRGARRPQPKAQAGPKNKIPVMGLGFQFVPLFTSGIIGAGTNHILIWGPVVAKSPTRSTQNPHLLGV